MQNTQRFPQITILWDGSQFNLVEIFWRLGGTYCLQLQRNCAEYYSRTFLRNVSKCSHWRRSAIFLTIGNLYWHIRKNIKSRISLPLQIRHLQRAVEIIMVVYCENLIRHTTRSERKCLNVRRYIDSPLCFKGLSALKGAYGSLSCSHKTINWRYLEAVQYTAQRHISVSSIPTHFHINFPSWSHIEIFFLQIYLLLRVSRLF